MYLGDTSEIRIANVPSRAPRGKGALFATRFWVQLFGRNSEGECVKLNIRETSGIQNQAEIARLAEYFFNLKHNAFRYCNHNLTKTDRLPVIAFAIYKNAYNTDLVQWWSINRGPSAEDMRGPTWKNRAPFGCYYGNNWAQYLTHNENTYFSLTKWYEENAKLQKRDMVKGVENGRFHSWVITDINDFLDTITVQAVDPVTNAISERKQVLTWHTYADVTDEEVDPHYSFEGQTTEIILKPDGKYGDVYKCWPWRNYGTGNTMETYKYNQRSSKYIVASRKDVLELLGEQQYYKKHKPTRKQLHKGYRNNFNAKADEGRIFDDREGTDYEVASGYAGQEEGLCYDEAFMNEQFFNEKQYKEHNDISFSSISRGIPEFFAVLFILGIEILCVSAAIILLMTMGPIALFSI